ncbi:MAG: YtcA family lipoprotein [Pusillimonas sp.]
MSVLQNTHPALAIAARLFTLANLLTLSACGQGRAPSFMIMGSYFPAWLVGLAISITLTVIIRQVLIRAGLDDALPVRLVDAGCTTTRRNG